MAVTEEGLTWLWSGLPTRLASARLRVGDGTTMAEAPLSKPPEYVGIIQAEEQVEEDEAPEAPETVTLVRILLTADFGPNEANSEWSQTEIVLDGKVLDVSDVDLGRKAQGTASKLETYFDAVVG